MVRGWVGATVCTSTLAPIASRRSLSLSVSRRQQTRSLATESQEKRFEQFHLSDDSICSRVDRNLSLVTVCCVPKEQRAVCRFIVYLPLIQPSSPPQFYLRKGNRDEKEGKKKRRRSTIARSQSTTVVHWSTGIPQDSVILIASAPEIKAPRE